MYGFSPDLNVDPWEHTCTHAEWVAGSTTEPPVYEPEQLWRCDACGRDFPTPQRMVAHLTRAHGWVKRRALVECGLGESREGRRR